MIFVRIIVYIGLVGFFLFSPFLEKKQHTVVQASKNYKYVNVMLMSPPIQKKKEEKKQKMIKKVTPPIKKKRKVIQKSKKKQLIKKEVKKIPKKALIKKVIPKPKEQIKEQKIPKKEQKKQLKQVSSQKEQAYKKEIEQKYFHSVYKTIETYKKFPKKAKRFKKQGSVKVGFTILSNGVFRNFHILKKAKYSVFNKSVKKLFNNINKFPLPPSELKTPIDIEITISYKLH